MQVIYHGHSFIEIEREHDSILVNPFVTDNPRCDISLEEIYKKSIQSIVVTDNQNQYFGDTIAIAKELGCSVIASQEVRDFILSQGFPEQQLQTEGENFSVEFVSFDRSDDPDGNGSGYGVVIQADRFRIYYAGAVGYYEDMNNIKDIHLALLPIGGDMTMGLEDAVRACGLIKPKIVVPIQYNTWSKNKADDIEFARQVMLAQYAVPKVLRAGQYVVL